MRVFRVFALSATALLLPAFAVADPMQAPASANTGARPSTDAQAPSQTATQPAQTATAPATAAPARSTTTSAGDDLDQIVCKEMPARTGSRIGAGRECRTQREWRRLQQEGRDVTRLQRRMKYAAP